MISEPYRSRLGDACLMLWYGTTMPDDVESEGVTGEGSEVEQHLRVAGPVTGRLAVLTGMSFLAGSIPIPLLPSRALAQLRGAIVHEIASRHGLSLSSGARALLAEPTSKDRVRDALRRGVELILKRLLRRLGPLGPLSTLARTVEVYALGVMLERYLDRHRRERSARILDDEARRIRETIDAAVVRALYPSVKASSLMLPEGAEDMRDEFTRWVDSALVTTATLPSYLERRLIAAFDDVVAERGHR